MIGQPDESKLCIVRLSTGEQFVAGWDAGTAVGRVADAIRNSAYAVGIAPLLNVPIYRSWTAERGVKHRCINALHIIEVESFDRTPLPTNADPRLRRG